MDSLSTLKFFDQYSVPELGEKAIELGYDGIDLCVRPGHPIHADNVIEALPKAAEVWRSQDLICPMITAPVTLIDPESPEIENYYTACAEAEIPRLKIGFWKYQPGDDYWQVVDTARRDLKKIVRLSEKYGVADLLSDSQRALSGKQLCGIDAPHQRLCPAIRGRIPRFRTSRTGWRRLGNGIGDDSGLYLSCGH